MPAKKRKAAGQPAAKRPRTAPLDCDAFWGRICNDVASAVDWPKLQEALDELITGALWANKLTHIAVRERLPLIINAGTRQPLLAAVAGKRPTEQEHEEEMLNAAESPASKPHFAVSSSIELRDSPGKGRGWFTRLPLDAGTMILVERPLVASLDVEWRGKKWGECGSADTTALGLELAACYSKSLGVSLSQFHPQACPADSSSAAKPQPDDEEDDDPQALAALQAAEASGWKQVEGISESEKKRLQAVVRLNSLGFYTHSEQLCHHGNFTALTGSGLFALASGFNHSCAPSVARFSLGDITVFVTNQPVKPGDELCISYIESELLSAPISLRRQSLNRDFLCQCTKCSAEKDIEALAGRGKRNFLRVDAQVQASLSLLPAEERVAAVEAALSGQMGDDEGEEEEEKEKDEVFPDEGCRQEKDDTSGSCTVLLGKDAQELRVVQAIALMQLGSRADALKVWRKLAAFSFHHCPPFDESIAVYATQAALCALAVADGRAADYVRLAKEAHRAAFGAELFQWRYRKEVLESSAPADTKTEFWRLVAEEPTRSVPSAAEAAGAWHFTPDEVPPNYEQFPDVK